MKIDPKQELLTDEQLSILNQMWKDSVEDILNSTSLATCGHPGGSMSSIHFLLVLYGLANIRLNTVSSKERDRVIISHGHISPGLYATLARYGFFDRDEMVLNFRKMASKYAGHVEMGVPGVEWNTGNLGQGVSAACGIALAGKYNNLDVKTIVCMGDGEQQKGQISEARRAAVKFKLNNLIGIIDYNHCQIGGDISDIMPQDIHQNYLSDGWNVLQVENGHDFQEIYKALRKVWNNDVEKKEHPSVIIAKTIMGYGVSFMSEKCDFHGRACKPDEHEKACLELNIENKLTHLKEKRNQLPFGTAPRDPFVPPKINIDPGETITYDVNVLTDNRSAYGAALVDLAKKNNFDSTKNSIIGISCDLEGSVKMTAFKNMDPKSFFECGIQEHHSAVMAGSLSKEGLQVFFSTFGVFGVDEVYNQQRLNGFNNTNVKTVCTHLGLSVGEDGPTHQGIDYIGLLRNIPNYSIFIPADPNQTDHVIRHVASRYGNYFVGMGRAKTPVITNKVGEPFFGNDYEFIPGKMELLREGSDATIIANGPLLDYALKVADKLSKKNSLQIRVLNMCSVIPFDREAIKRAVKETGALLTVEDHYYCTGIGSIVDQVLVEEQLALPVKHLGVKCFVGSGTPPELYKDQGMGLDDIEEQIRLIVKSKSQKK
ncbi:transketolase [bacterium B13(2017)]|nr:transketolase [bacterium B13(2017)]